MEDEFNFTWTCSGKKKRRLESFFEAVKKDDLTTVDRLLKQGHDIEIIDEASGMNSLHFAVSNGSYEIVKRLLNNTVRIATICSSGRYHASELPIKYDVDVYRTGLKENAASRVDCCSEDENHLRILPEKVECIINSQDYDGNTPLHIACSSGFTNIVKLLLNSDEIATVYDEHKSHVDERCCTTIRRRKCVTPKRTKRRPFISIERKYLSDMPIHVLSCKICCWKIKHLKDTAADVNIVNRSNETALHSAILRGYVEIVQLLLERCPDIRVRNYKYNEILTRSIMEFPDVLKALLNFGEYISENIIFGTITYMNNQYTRFNIPKHLKTPESNSLSIMKKSTVKLVENVETLQVIELLCALSLQIKDLCNDNSLPYYIYCFVKFCDLFWSNTFVRYIVSASGDERVFAVVTSNLHPTNDLKRLKENFLGSFNSRHNSAILNATLKNCLKEVEMMKTPLGDLNVSLYDLLQKTFDELVVCFRNEALLKALNRHYNISQFPTTGGVIRLIFNGVLRKRFLFDDCVQYFSCAYSGCPTLPFTVVEDILNKLEIRDLNAFAFACHSLV